MNEDLQQDNSISRTNSGFPPYLDWDQMRSDAIGYLGQLTGKIWTDYNTHDPGITILETLCYALIDLGYRTNLPVQDLFAKDPAATTEDNFFTPAQILTCNPVTITDFRKLLIDIEGVKNAWLEDAAILDTRAYNGLYHVYVEIEIEPDPTDPAYNALIEKIKDILMAHRNLCEDFLDIHVLCKKTFGLCADIELEVDADVKTVYRNIIESLRNFFSPSPKFYTLSQLLDDKGKNIEDIFAGRPFNTTESHGFVDTEEFEQITLKKEIHLSDVYHVIFDVKGVRSVKNLAWRKTCDNSTKPDKSWVWKLPDNHVPDFSPDCSVISFNRKGVPVAVDTTKFNLLFDIDFNHNGKVLYTAPSPYLDLVMPVGQYRTDLGDYQSIQNEFPRVYGIAKGGLPGDASARRQAQALQLKGFLLFFDQLLANYVAQLKNVRSLFSFAAPAKGTTGTTYFTNELTDVAELQQLIRFDIGPGSMGIAGTQGSTLAIPFDRRKFEELVMTDKIKKICGEGDFEPFTYSTLYDCDVAVANLMQDLLFGDYTPAFFCNENNRWFFCYPTSDENFVLVGKQFYPDREAAMEGASTVRYTGTYPENFFTFMDGEDKCSFSLKLKMADYADYLKKMTEDAALYAQRREAFLNHLLSRFAEQFTDFAMLSFGFLDEKKLMKKEIADKENFLTNYDELSSNRGKGYDYRRNGWKSTNISGLEQRFAAKAGIGKAKKEKLCNFVVEQYETQFIFEISFPGFAPMFSPSDRFFSMEAAAQAAQTLLRALQSPDNVDVDYDGTLSVFRVRAHYDDGRIALYNGRFTTEDEALFARDALVNLFSILPGEKDIYKGRKAQKLILTDYAHKELAIAKADYATLDEAKAAAAQPPTITTSDNWNWEGDPVNFGNIYLDTTNTDAFAILQIDPFTIDCDRDIVGRPDKCRYQVRYTNNEFIYTSVDEFSTEVEAKNEAIHQLTLLADRSSYHVHKTKGGIYRLQFKLGKKLIGVFEGDFEYPRAAERNRDLVMAIVRKHLFLLTTQEKTIRWNFGIHMGFEKDGYFFFKSNDEFENANTALLKAREWYAAMGSLSVEGQGPATILSCNTLSGQTACTYQPTAGDGDIDLKIAGLTALRRHIFQLDTGDPSQSWQQFVHNTEPDPDLQYVYRLVDRNHYRAFYTGTTQLNSENDLTAKKNDLFQGRVKYLYPDISLAGDIAVQEKDGYHYKIQLTRACGQWPAGTILFESVAIYGSPSDAAVDYAAIYLQIIAKAMADTNYGHDAFISLQEIPVNELAKTRSVVFVPAATRQLFNNDNTQVQTELIRLAKQYPVRYLLDDSEEFKQRFACKPDQTPSAPQTSCDTSAPVPKTLYFYILADSEGVEQWQSTTWFETADKTLHKFNDFVSLLNYPGNYAVDFDSCVCGWRIVLREVLAESVLKFISKDQAWGKAGVEKFICAVQSGNAMQPFFRTGQDDYSFTVECGEPPIIHPNEYDTAAQRDQVISRLWHSFADSADKPQASMTLDTDQCVLFDREGQKLAIVTASDGDAGHACTTKLADLEVLIEQNGWATNEADKKLSIPGSKVSFAPYDSQADFKTWEKQVKTLFYYYPVRKTTDGLYRLDLKLPGYEGTAWQSLAGFATDQPVLDFLAQMKPYLLDPSNYKAVFDCECGPYGIQLNALVDMVAFNPQSYQTPEMVCDAIKKSVSLVNTEGIHLVEHILLRPRTEQERACMLQPCPQGQQKFTCSPWTWSLSGQQDPCDPTIASFQFSPGADPYSFIATLALPAWPERFRTTHNRQIVENLLYLEAPAHVLLRILWLAPKDLDRFETFFREWTAWNSVDYKSCATGNPSCDFIQFLFHSDFECLTACTDCVPQTTTLTQNTGCNEPTANTDPCAGISIVDTINGLYCWETMQCIPDMQIPVEIDPARNLAPKDQAKAFNQRTDSYRKSVDRVLPEENDLKGQVIRFLNDPNPTNQKYTDLLNNIAGQAGQGAAAGPVAVHDELARIVTSQYLDRLVAANGNIDSISDLRGLFKQLYSSGQLNLFSILKNWQ